MLFSVAIRWICFLHTLPFYPVDRYYVCFCDICLNYDDFNEQIQIQIQIGLGPMICGFQEEFDFKQCKCFNVSGIHYLNTIGGFIIAAGLLVV